LSRNITLPGGAKGRARDKKCCKKSRIATARKIKAAAPAGLVFTTSQAPAAKSFPQGGEGAAPTTVSAVTPEPLPLQAGHETFLSGCVKTAPEA
jgi:hypothetical protein